MGNTWVVVADSHRARIFSTDSDHRLHEIADLVHEQAHLRDQERHSDRPGHQASPGGSRHDVEERSHAVEQERFASEIVEYLDKAYNGDSWSRLLLACEPKMLGTLRKKMPSTLRKHIATEIDKNFVAMPTHELPNHLPI